MCLVVKDVGGKEPEVEMGEEMNLKARLSRTHPLRGVRQLVLKRPSDCSSFIYWHGHSVFSMGIWFPSLSPLALYLAAEPAEGRG